MARRRGVRESARDIELQLRAKIAKEAELDKENAALAERVKAAVQSETPIASGDAVGSIQVEKLRKSRKHPLPGRRVFSDDPNFHLIEYGTKADVKGPEHRRVEIDGQWVTLDRDTPTEAAAPFGKARARFGDQIK